MSAWDAEAGRGEAGAGDTFAWLDGMIPLPFPSFSKEATDSTAWPFVWGVFLAAGLGLPLTSVEGDDAIAFGGSASFAAPLTPFAFSCALVIFKVEGKKVSLGPRVWNVIASSARRRSREGEGVLWLPGCEVVK
jgi:hypothetical protein